MGKSTCGAVEDDARKGSDAKRSSDRYSRADFQGLAIAHEFLISQGHSDADLWSYSIEKTVYLAHLATERVAREEARNALTLSSAIRVQIWGEDKAVEKLEKDLRKRASIPTHEEEKKERKRRLSGLVAEVKARGGKVTNG